MNIYSGSAGRFVARRARARREAKFSLDSGELQPRPHTMLPMRDRAPVCASWRERLTKPPCAVTLSMSLGDFIEVLEQNRQALLARRLGPRDLNGTHVRTQPPDRETNGAAPSPVHFPLELTEPGPIALPPILQEGRGRPSGLTDARARRVIAMACAGASIPVCAAAGGVTPNTLKSWLRRKDHEAFTLFQRYYAEALTYATLAALKAITEGIASNPKHAFEFLARRAPDRWTAGVR